VKGYFFALLIISFVLLKFPQNVFAALNFGTSQTTVTEDEEILLDTNLSLSGQNNKSYYLEGAFQKEGVNKYFGQTFNVSEWIKYTSADYTSVLKVTTDDNGVWSGQISVKVDISSPYYSGAGNYVLKIKRFTEAGNYSWSSNQVTIAVAAIETPSPQPSPSPTPSPTPSPSPKPTKSTIKNTASPSPSSSPSPSLLPTPSPSPKTQPKPTPSKINYKVPDLSGDVAGISTPSSSTPTYNETKTSPERIKKLPIILGSVAVLLIISSAIIFLIKSNPSLINKFFKK